MLRIEITFIKYPVGGFIPTFTLRLPLEIGFEPDYYHLDWLSQVWGFQWHKRFDPFDDIPF